MSGVSEELILLERVFLKIGTVDTDEDLESSLSKILPHVISKMSSPSEEVRGKVIELLTHINKRVKSRSCVQLPVETLLSQYQDPSASAFIINFAIIYIKLGFPRLPPEKRVELLPSLVKAAEVKPVQHRDSLIYIIIGSLHLAKIPHDNKSYLSLDQSPTVAKILLDVMQNIILYPYGWRGEGKPPELTNFAYNQLIQNLPEVTKGEQLEQLKLTCLKLLSCGVYDEKKMFPILAFASADARSSVFNLAEMNLRKIMGGLELDKAIVGPIYTVYMGGGEGDKKRGQANTRLRLKLLPYMAKSTYLPWPLCVQVLFDSIYGENTHSKLRSIALSYCSNMIKHLPDSQLSQVAEVVLKSGLMQLIESDWAEPPLIRLAFSCIGPLVSRTPKLASQTLLNNLFNALMQEKDIDVATSLRECLVAMASAYADQSDSEWLQSLVSEALGCHSAKARSAALHYLTNSHTKSCTQTYLLLNAANHVDEEVSNEAKKSLYGANYKLGQTDKNLSLVSFEQLATLILDKEGSKPVDTRLHSEMLFYLRLCLAKAASAPITLEQLDHPCESSKLITDYLEQLNSSNPTLIFRYVDFIFKIIDKDVAVVPVNCLIEILGCLPHVVRPVVETKIDKLMVHLGHAKEDVRRSVAHLIGLGTRSDQLSKLCSELIENSTGSDLEKCYGSMLAAGHCFERAVQIPPYSPPVTNLSNIVSNLSHNQQILVSGGCQALGHMARGSPLPLSLQEKENLVDKLMDIIFQQKHTSKIKDYACHTLGMLCIGEDFPHKEKIIKAFLDRCNEVKDVELVLSIGETLVSCILGDTGVNGLDLWTRREKEGGPKTPLAVCENTAATIVDYLLSQVNRPHPNIRQCCCFWLLSVTKHCCHLEIIKNKLQDIQNAFMELLSDSSSLVQEAAGRGLGIVYQSGGSVDKSQLLSRLVEQLTSGKRAVNTVSQDTKLFEEGQLGKAPTGGNLTTYKELCSLASDLNKPDLIYKFMSLANHNALWNSKKGAAFGVSTLVDLAGSEIEAHLPKIIAKLYRYQYDPTPSIQQSMTSIWQAFTSNITNVVEKYSEEIYRDLLTNIVSPQWRVRQSSCKALTDFMRSPASNVSMFQKCLNELPELWAQLFRVMDDVHEATREAATSTTKTLSRICMRQCEASSPLREKVAALIMPVILEKGIKSTVSEVRSLSINALSDLVKVGVAGKEVIQLVPALLIAAQELESATLSHLSVMVSGSQMAQEAVDSVRASAIKSHFTVQTLTKCVEYIKPEMLEELSPQLVDLLKGNVGMGTRLATCHFITLLFHTMPLESVQPFIGKFLAALLSGLSDRNSAIRKQYASTIGQLSRYAKESSIERLLVKLSKLFFEKEDEGIRLAIGYTLQALLSLSQDAVKSKASLILPLAFFAKHQIKLPDKSNETAIEVWEEVSDDSGGNSGLITHAIPVADLLIDCLQSPAWTNKAQAARGITTLAQKTSENLSAELRSRLVSIVITSLAGRTWENKHYLLHALSALAKNNSNKNDCEAILEAIEKECRREKLDYKCEAIKSYGDILATLKVDRFIIVHGFTKEILNMDCGEDKNIMENLVAASYETLGKAWPDDRLTQDKLCVEIITDCTGRLTKVPRQTQACVLGAILQIVESLHLLQQPNLLPPSSEIIDLCIKTLIHSLGVTKHTNLRKSALNLLLVLLNRTKGKSSVEFQKLAELYAKFKEDLNQDTSSEVRSRLADIKDVIKT